MAAASAYIPTSSVSEWNPGLLIPNSVPICHIMFFPYYLNPKTVYFILFFFSLFFNSAICCGSVEIAYILYKKQMPHE